MKIKNIIFVILFIEVQLLLGLAVFQYIQTFELETKVKRTNTFLYEIYDEKRNSSLEVIDEYDVIVGNPDIEQSIIFYFKDNCDACESFESNILPDVYDNLVATGKTKLIFRKLYPANDSLSSFSHQCAYFASKKGKGKYDKEVMDFLLTNSSSIEEMTKKLSGLFPEHKNLSKHLEAQDIITSFRAKIQNSRKAGINKTPTFLVNGQKLIGARKLAKFEELLSQ